MGYSSDGKEGGSDGKESSKDGGRDSGFILDEDVFMQTDSETEVFTF